MAIENLRRHLIFSTFKFEYKKFGGKKTKKKHDWLGTTVAVKLSFAVSRLPFAGGTATGGDVARLRLPHAERRGPTRLKKNAHSREDSKLPSQISFCHCVA
jgi:hypothetical protein